MIRSYADQGTADIARGTNSAAARRVLPSKLHALARRRLAAVNAATTPMDLNIPGWRLEKLKGDREGQYSIRINQRYRICFDWSGRDALNVEIVDYH